MKYLNSIVLLIVAAAIHSIAAEEPASNTNVTTTSTSKRLFTYSGPLLPSEWTLISTIDDRAIIAFKNGSARNAPMSELDLKDRNFIEKLQNGTVYATPLASVKEKLAQWSSSVSKFGKSVKDQFDSLISKKQDTPAVANTTTIGVI